MSAEPLVALDGVFFAHPLPGGEARPALRAVSLAVRPGEFLVVLGAGGSGKSTLAALMAGVLRPDAGSVRRAPVPEGGKPVLPVGLVTQNPEDSFSTPEVREEMAAVLENLDRDPADVERVVAAALEAVGLEGHADAHPASLSGGQKQLLAIASVLVAGPPLLVLDEPLTLLDGPGRAEVERLLRHSLGPGSATVWMTSEVEDAARGDRLVVLAAGTIVWEGLPGDLPRTDARLAAWGLVAPDLDALGDALQAAGHPLHPPYDDPGSMARGLDAALLGPPAGPPPAGRPAVGGPVLRAAGVRFAYDCGTARERPVLLGVDLEARAGEVLGVIGPIGSGKTTLAQHLNGLLVPQQGRLEVAGRVIGPDSPPGRPLAAEAGLVFQFPEKQLFAETVLEDVALGPEFAGKTQGQALELARAALERVGLDPAVHGPRPPFGLTWGEKRLAAIAGVLVLGTPVVILDEPGAGLDPAGRRRVMDLAADLARRGGRAVVIVSHHLDDLFRVADRVAVLHQGRIAFAGTLAELCAAGGIEAWGLAWPPLVRFARALAGLRPGTRTDVRTPEEAFAAAGAAPRPR